MSHLLLQICAARRAYDAQVASTISENDELIASTTELILESKALLARVDRLMNGTTTSAGAQTSAEEPLQRT